jgi:hypothetical protein
MIFNGNRANISEAIRILQDIKKRGYSMSMGFCEKSDSVLISVRKHDASMDRRTILITGLTPSTKQRIKEIATTADFIVHGDNPGAERIKSSYRDELFSFLNNKPTSSKKLKK